PLYRPPAQLHLRKPWYSRQEIDTLPEAQAALKGREIAWLADPVAALNLQIQGSGRLLVNEPDGRQRMVRIGYAGTNDQPYRSVGGWLQQRREIRDASWPSIRQWVAQNPGRVECHTSARAPPAPSDTWRASRSSSASVVVPISFSGARWSSTSSTAPECRQDSASPV
ncbi:MAG: MltA domain-containing protein, partial [Myxococcota bacterium]